MSDGLTNETPDAGNVLSKEQQNAVTAGKIVDDIIEKAKEDFASMGEGANDPAAPAAETLAKERPPAAEEKEKVDDKGSASASQEEPPKEPESQPEVEKGKTDEKIEVNKDSAETIGLVEPTKENTGGDSATDNTGEPKSEPVSEDKPVIGQEAKLNEGGEASPKEGVEASPPDAGAEAVSAEEPKPEGTTEDKSNDGEETKPNGEGQTNPVNAGANPESAEDAKPVTASEDKPTDGGEARPKEEGDTAPVDATGAKADSVEEPKSEITPGDKPIDEGEAKPMAVDASTNKDTAVEVDNKEDSKPVDEADKPSEASGSKPDGEAEVKPDSAAEPSPGDPENASESVKEGKPEETADEKPAAIGKEVSKPTDAGTEATKGDTEAVPGDNKLEETTKVTGGVVEAAPKETTANAEEPKPSEADTADEKTGDQSATPGGTEEAASTNVAEATSDGAVEITSTSVAEATADSTAEISSEDVAKVEDKAEATVSDTGDPKSDTSIEATPISDETKTAGTDKAVEEASPMQAEEKQSSSIENETKPDEPDEAPSSDSSKPEKAEKEEAGPKSTYEEAGGSKQMTEDDSKIVVKEDGGTAEATSLDTDKSAEATTTKETNENMKMGAVAQATDGIKDSETKDRQTDSRRSSKVSSDLKRGSKGSLDSKRGSKGSLESKRGSKASSHSSKASLNGSKASPHGSKASLQTGKGTTTPVSKTDGSNQQNEIPFHTEYLARQIKEGRESEGYLKQKLQEKERDLETADRKVKDLQLRLKRFAKDDQAKDNRIMQIERENRDLVDKLNTMAEMMDQNENRTVDTAAPKQGGALAKEKNTQQNSRTCVLL